MTQEFVTLPREVVEQALEAFAVLLTYNTSSTEYAAGRSARDALRAALKQPKNHVPDAGNMVTAGWKLVPIEFTREMIEAGKDAHYEAEKRIQEPGAWEQGGFAKRAVRATHVFQAMLAAAPKPPTVKDSLTVEQPQANQPAMTPIAQRKLDSLLTEGYTISGYSVYHERKHQHGFVTGAGLVGWWKPEGMEHVQPQGEQEPVAIPDECPHIIWFDDSDMRPMMFAGRGGRDAALKAFERVSVQWNAHLFVRIQKNSRDDQYPCAQLYTHPQPKRQPLTDDQHERLMRGLSTLEYGRSVERAHNIK